MDDGARMRKKKAEKSEHVKPAEKSSSSKQRRKKKTTCFGKCWKLLKLAIFLTFCLLTVLVSACWYYTPDIQPVKYELSEPLEFTGPLAPNNRLTGAKLLLKNEIEGPESLIIEDDKIITGTYDGKIVEIKNGKVINEIRLSKESCGSYDLEPTCGRPLGLRRSKRGTILVVDAYLGLFEVDFKTNKIEKLVTGSQLVEGRPLTFLNDLVELSNGTVLFTDSSSKWTRRDFLFSLLEGSGDGRLLSYCPKTKNVRVLIDNLHFPNGVQVDSNENLVLVNELSRARILKYHLKGAKQNKVEIFAENLPGFPDNIRMARKGGYWVGISTPRRKGVLSLLDALAPYPLIRKILAKLSPTKYAVPVMHKLLPQYGLVILLDENGRIVDSLHDPTGKQVPDVSEVEDDGSSLYLGSYHSKFIAKVDYK